MSDQPQILLIRPSVWARMKKRVFRPTRLTGGIVSDTDDGLMLTPPPAPRIGAGGHPWVWAYIYSLGTNQIVLSFNDDLSSPFFTCYFYAGCGTGGMTWNPVVAILRNKPVIGQKMRVRLMDAADLAAAGLTGENAPEGPVYMAFGDYMEICT